jgi:hypothetical protein
MTMSAGSSKHVMNARHDQRNISTYPNSPDSTITVPKSIHRHNVHAKIEWISIHHTCTVLTICIPRMEDAEAGEWLIPWSIHF